MKKGLKIFFIIRILLVIVFMIYAYSPVKEKSVFIKKHSYVDSKFIMINGLNVHYHIVGNGPDLLLLHGLGGNIHHFDSITPILSKHFRVISLDCLGHGLTDTDLKNNYSNENNLLFLETFIKTLHIQKLSIVGHALGGYWAMLYAKKHPLQVDKLVLLSSMGGTCKQPEETTDTGFSPENLPFAAELSEYFLPPVLVKGTLKNMFADPSKVSDNLVENTCDLFSIKGKRLLRKYFARYKHPNYILTKITTASLLIVGRNDNTHTLCQGEELHQKLPNSQLVILENTGHLSMIENPKGTLAAMLKFLL